MKISRFSMQLPITQADELDISRVGIALPASLSKAIPSRQREFVLGRYCAYRALLDLSGASYPSIEISESRAPVWPAGFVGSITHTEGFVSAAVAFHSECISLGVDSQKWMTEESAHKLSDRILHPEEARWDDPWDPASRVTFVFAAKEALFKCLHPLVKEFFGFQDATITDFESLPEAQSGEFKIRVNRNLGGEDFKVSANTEFRGWFRRDESSVHTEVVIPR